MDLSKLLSGLTGKGGASSEEAPPTGASATKKSKAGGSAPQISIPADRFNDAAKVDVSAEKLGTDADRVRAKQNNELIRLNTGIFNTLRNMHEFSKEYAKNQNMAAKIAAVESDKTSEDATAVGSKSKAGGLGSSILTGALLGALLPALAMLAKAFEGVSDFIGSIFGTKGIRAGEEAAGGVAVGTGAAKSFLNRFSGRPTGEPEPQATRVGEGGKGSGKPGAEPETRVREGFREENGRYRNTKTGRMASAADAVEQVAAVAQEEVRPGTLQRITKSVIKGVRGTTLAILKKILAFAAKYERLLAVLVYLIEPVIKLIESGGEITKEVKKSFAKALVGLLLNEAAAAAIGAILGSVVPGPGTIIGAVFGAGASFALGMLAGAVIEVIADELAAAIVGEKGWGEAANNISEQVKSAAVNAVDSAAAAVSQTGASYGATAYNKTKEALGGGVTGTIIGAGAAQVGFVAGATVDAASAVGGAVSSGASAVANFFSGGSDKKDATPQTAPPTVAGGAETPSAKELLKPKGMGGGRVSPIGGMSEVKNMVKAHEGLRTKAYKDSVGKWTIGYGHLIGDGSSPGEYAGRTLSEKEVDDLFEEDFAKHYKIAERTPGWSKANMTGKAAMIDLAFNMGQWWPKWKQTSSALEAGNGEKAAAGLRDSKWYTQVKGRGEQIASMIAVGFTGGGDAEANVASEQSSSDAKPTETAANSGEATAQATPTVSTETTQATQQAAAQAKPETTPTVSTETTQATPQATAQAKPETTPTNPTAPTDQATPTSPAATAKTDQATPVTKLAADLKAMSDEDFEQYATVIAKAGAKPEEAKALKADPRFAKFREKRRAASNASDAALAASGKGQAVRSFDDDSVATPVQKTPGSEQTADASVAPGVRSAQVQYDAMMKAGTPAQQAAAKDKLDKATAAAQPPKVDTASQISPTPADSAGGRRGRMASSAGGGGGAGRSGQTIGMPGNQSIPAPTASKGGLDLLWYFGAAA